MLQYKTTGSHPDSTQARPHNGAPRKGHNRKGESRKDHARTGEDRQRSTSEDGGQSRSQHRPTGPDRRYVLSLDELDEVLALLTDAPGDADEDMLLEALDSLYMPKDVAGSVLDEIQSGKVAAFRLDANERMALRSLITEFESSTSERMRQRLISILESAESHAKERSQKK